MELRHLRYFAAVAEELHFGRAAARLHIAQPPLSQQIKTLENELGVKLFERTRRRVELTDAGRIFLVEALATIKQAARAEAVARAAAEGKRGRLTIGFVTSACYSVIPSAVRAFTKAHPDVELSLQEMVPAAQIAALERQEIDLGLLRPPVRHNTIVSQTIFSEPLVVAVPRGHKLAAQKSISLKSLKDQPLILFPRKHGPGLYDVIYKAFQESGLIPIPARETNEMQSILAHVAGGLGISLVPGSLSGFHALDIVYRPIAGSKACIQLSAVWPKHHTSPLRDKFISDCMSAGRECTKRIRH